MQFLNNDVHTEFNEAAGGYPTVQCLYLIGSEDVLVDGNNFTMIDTVSELGSSSYLYAITFGYDKSTVISNNNFFVSTLSGVDSAGTAYALQGVESELSIVGNNITCTSNGPNIGIYVTSMMGGSSDVYIENNNIDVTGAAETANQWALVSGIEITNGDAKIYNNTINTYNKNGYVEDAPVYGISYGQMMYGGRSVDAQDNTIYTEGKYTVSFLDGTGMSITNNYLVAHELKGDESVNGAATVKDNFPAKANLVVTVENITVGSKATINVSIHEKTANDVQVIIDGKTYDVEIKDGKGSYSLAGLTQGSHELYLNYTIDGTNYESNLYPLVEKKSSSTGKSASKSTSTAKKIVKKNTKIVAVKKTFKKSKKTKKYTITLKSGKKLVKNAKITLKIKKKLYTARTNKKGKATFYIKNLKKKGKYTAVIKFAGSKYYNKSTKKIRITVKK